MLLLFSFFPRSISGQGVKVEYNKRRMSRDLLVSKDMLSLKSREGKDNCSLDKNNEIWGSSNLSVDCGKVVSYFDALIGMPLVWGRACLVSLAFVCGKILSFLF